MIYNFKTSEIETIVKVILEAKKQEEFYGYNDDEYEFPVLINDKVNSLSSDEYSDFINTCEEIAEEVQETLSGELNMLHRLHDEIRIIVDSYSAE